MNHHTPDPGGGFGPPPQGPYGPQGQDRPQPQGQPDAHGYQQPQQGHPQPQQPYDPQTTQQPQAAQAFLDSHAPQGSQGGWGGQPPQGPAGPTPPPPPARPGRYGTGILAVLTVIAVLAGASFLGGGIVLGQTVLSGFAEDAPPEPSDTPTEEPTEEPSPTPDPYEPTGEPTEEPTGAPTSEPEELLTSEELVDALADGFDIAGRLDTTDDVCAPESGGEETPFRCTSAMDTNLVRVIAFENVGIASIVAVGLAADEESEAVDVQSACHFVFIWFEVNGTDQGQRDDMVSTAEEITGCV
ncbi:hypothetical protein ACIBFB_01870 [Nocardiopsis sp. NPDC050513]|uniref:hypothetical protein n=1 Tax=Nocardiopsis sp. NPDC050513 TaxID=3364338 RepID=UPI0037B871B3